MIEQKQRISRRLNAEADRISNLLPYGNDISLIVLKAHLLTEHYLDRILKAHLPNGAKFLRNTRLMYAGKLTLADGCGLLSNADYQSLKKLNDVRNELVHKLDAQPSVDDIVEIGKPFGKKFSAIDRNSPPAPYQYIREVFSLVLHELVNTTVLLEDDKDS